MGTPTCPAGLPCQVPGAHLTPLCGALPVEGRLPRGHPAERAALPQTHYEQFHGFVVIHGTDTMAFAASVLAFVLENLQKTVVLTGAQVTWGQGPRPGLPAAAGEAAGPGIQLPLGPPLPGRLCQGPVLPGAARSEVPSGQGLGWAVVRSLWVAGSQA